MTKNKYFNWYFKIINNARERTVQGYETHHIIPKSMGGKDSKDNLVRLTLREHYICHLLLPKFTVGADRAKMKFALWCFANKWGRDKLEVRMTSRMYERLRIEIANQISSVNKGRIPTPMTADQRKKHSERMSGTNNPLYGKFGEKNPNFGKKRLGIGGRPKGTKWSAQERESQLKTRNVPGYYDYLKDPCRGEKISKSQLGRIGTSLGKVWYNDGTNEFYGDFVPNGFTKGRLISNASKLGMRWFNNGIENRQFKEGTQPEGFVHGRINKK